MTYIAHPLHRRFASVPLPVNGEDFLGLPHRQYPANKFSLPNS
jgi:hypothetical protein